MKITGELSGHQTVGESDTRPLLEAYSIPVIPGGTASNATDALDLAEKAGYPVVLKIAAENVFHKSDIGGVVLNLQTPSELSSAYIKMENQYIAGNNDPRNLK